MPQAARSLERSSKVRVDFGPHEINLIKHVMTDAITELEAQNSPLVAPEQILLTRIRISTTILMHAECGERDVDRLKDLAIDYVTNYGRSAVPR